MLEIVAKNDLNEIARILTALVLILGFKFPESFSLPLRI